MWKLSENDLNGSCFDTTLKQEFTETFQLSKFQLKTLAFLCLDNCFSSTAISSIASPSYFAISLENKITVFKEDTQEIFWEFKFNSNCNYITLSDDLCLLFAVESPGTIHLFHVPTSEPIWSYSCEGNGCLYSIQSIICSSPSSDVFSVYAFTKEGILFEFSNIETLALYKAMEEQTVSAFFSDVCIKNFDLSSMFPDYTVKSVFSNFSQISPVGIEVEPCLSDLSISDYYTIEDIVDGEFCTSSCSWNDEENKFSLFDFSGYGVMRKISCTRDGRYIVCLNQKQMLLIFSAFSQLNLAVWGEGDIQDFTLYNTVDPDSLSISESKIGMLRKLKRDHIFEIRKFPSLEFFHKIQLEEYAQLVPSKPNQDSWYIIEGNTSSVTEKSSALKISSVSESCPEARLMSLLNRRKFKEAEKYAKMCNLNEEVIFKTKISCMLKDYSSEETLKLSKKDQEQIWKEVENSLNKIKDVDFIKSCISTFTPEIEMMRKFLSCVNHWLVANSIEGAENLICEINQNENKLTTYNMLPDIVQSSLSLKEFLKKDLLQFLISELIGGSLSTALIVWQSHKNELLISLTSEQVQEILNAIPDDIPSLHLIVFLKEDFLPFVLTKIPEVVDIVADWMISRIHLLELTEKESWPENGDHLASMFLEVIQMLQENVGKRAISYSTSTSLSYVHKKLINDDCRTGCLYELSKNLKFLVKIKEEFNCKISLTTFQDSKMDVMFALLDRVNLKFISKAVTDVVRPYALENGLDLDLTLSLYIKNTLQNSQFTWWSWDETPWEEHLSLVLQCIHDTDRWIKSALLFVSHATVPWSDRVKSIVEQGLNSDHPSKEDFKQQSRQVCLKEILVKYDIRNFPMNNDLQLIYTLVNYIFKQNRASAFEDVKIVVLSCNDSLTVGAYKKFLQFFLNQDKVEELMALLMSIPIDIAIECSYSILRNISFALEDYFLIKNNAKQTKNYLNVGILLIEFLKSKKQPVDQDLLDAFRCMLKLVKEFDIHVPMCDIMQKENALKIVESHVHLLLEASCRQHENKQVSLPMLVFKTKRLGSILGLEMTSVLTVLITNFLQRKMYDLVINLCGDLISSYPTTSSAETLIEVVNHFLQNFQNIKNMSFKAIVSAVCHLSNLVITYCETANIEKYMYAVRLSTYLSVLNRVIGQQLSGLPSMKTDIYNKWKLDAFYEDDGFLLDIVNVVDFVVKLLPLFIRNSCNLENALDFPIEEVFNAFFKPLILHMKGSGQELTALRTMFLFYHLQMEFFQNNTSSQEAFALVVGYVKDSIYNILLRIIDKRKLDMDLSIGLLSVFPNEQSQILKKLQRWSVKDIRCIMYLGEIASECCRVFESPEYSEYDKIYRRALLLLKQNVETKQTDIALNSADSDYNWDVVKEIILCPKTNLATVYECCSAFDLIADHVLIAYLNNLLIESEKLCISNAKDKEATLQPMLDQTKCAIESISSEALVVKNLESLLKKISSYSYEVLLFVHEQLLTASANILTISSGQFERTLALLNFLRLYQRVSPPGEIELERWISLHPADTDLPVIAHKRLPFWCIYEEKLYKIINPELTSNTLTVWLRIASLLDISKDELVMIAVKNVVMNYLKKLPTKHLTLHQDSSFMHNIYEMLRNISDSQMAVACASWVASRMPPGPNKVCSCMIAVNFSQKWNDLQPNDRKASDIYKKSKELYQRSAVERILYQNNLSNDISLSYVQNPVQLIEYFIEEFSLSSESSIKVCKVAAEIGKVMDISIDEIFKKKLLKWMHSTQTSDNLDETFAFNDSTENIDIQDDCDDKNIIRAINMLLGVSAINLKICESMKDDFLMMTVIQRSRFTFCTVAVYGYTLVAKILNMSCDMLEESLSLFLCTAELEHLHLLYSKEMVASNKIAELVQTILSNQRNNPKVLLCCVRMCIEYKIWYSHIWDVLLQRLVMMTMTESLKDILLTVQGHLTHMWHYKSFISAWNSIVSYCFKDEFTDVSRFIESIYKTILSCPCVSALDIESIWNDLKYFIKNIKGKDLKEMEPVSDAERFIQVLKQLKGDC